MLVDLLSTSNYISFNIKVAEMLGLHTAIYISELMNINEKAERKKKVESVDGLNYFTIDRKYITSRTTLTDKEQKELDDNLEALDLLKRFKNADKKDTIYLNLDALAAMLGTEDKTILANIEKYIKNKVPKKTKQEAILDNLKSKIKTTNEELQLAYYGWINSVSESGGKPLNTIAVLDAQDLIDKYTNKNLDLALELIHKASVNGWRDMQWAINTYESDLARKSKYTNTSIRIPKAETTTTIQHNETEVQWGSETF